MVVEGSRTGEVDSQRGLAHGRASGDDDHLAGLKPLRQIVDVPEARRDPAFDLVHRPDFYDKEDRPGEADIIMAKHRNGPTDTFHLAFVGSTSKFKDMPQDRQQGV